MASWSQDRRLVLTFLAVWLLLQVYTLSPQAEEIVPDGVEKPPVIVKATTVANGSEGLATYYGKRYNGKRTTSGQRYDPGKMTAAHQSLPFGTRVKVINLANAREVVVTINDRCRKRRQPYIDISRSAAKKLGFLGKGRARVRIVPLDVESS
ncbi:MAG: septal ring lytic transglycosylase RlpA family protein [Geobacteraceae bacterium]